MSTRKFQWNFTSTDDDGNEYMFNVIAGTFEKAEKTIKQLKIPRKITKNMVFQSVYEDNVLTTCASTEE